MTLTFNTVDTHRHSLGIRYEFIHDILRFTFLSAAFAHLYSGLRAASIFRLVYFDLCWFIPYTRPHPQLRSIDYRPTAKHTEAKPHLRPAVFHQMVYSPRRRDRRIGVRLCVWRYTSYP